MSEGTFILGGEGFVGSHIARTLLAQGRRVTTFGPAMAVDLLPDAGPDLRRVRGSAQDAAQLLDALRQSGARTLVWSAGFNASASGLMASGETDVATAIAVNVGAWGNALRAAAQAGVTRVVACGSSVVYGAATDYDGPVGEDAALLPRSIYGLTKSLAESTAFHFIRTDGLEITTARLPLIFGPGRWYGGAAAGLVRLVEAAACVEPVELTLPEDAFDLMYVKDAARAIAQLLDAPTVAPVYNVNGFTTTHRQIVAALQEHCPDFTPRISYQRSPWHYPLMDTTLIEQELGFRPAYPLVAALQDYLRELRK